jgi:hypothetical protein
MKVTFKNITDHLDEIGGTVLTHARVGNSFVLEVEDPRYHVWNQGSHALVDTVNYPYRPDYADMLARMRAGIELSQ